MDELLTTSQVTAAIAYNTKKAGVLWKTDEVQAALRMNAKASVGTPGFAVAVAAFQKQHELDVDGCLGPATLALLRSTAQTAPAAGPAVPARTGVSNQIIVNGQRVLMPQEFLAAGLTCSNWIDDADAHEDVHFQAKPRSGAVTNIVIHESVTNSVAGTVDTLLPKGYGVHFCIAPDGHISCHNDPVKDYLVHGNQMNGRGVGVEVVNPYSPKYAKPPFTKTIPAQWWTWVADPKRAAYTVPTDAQMAALRALCQWLCTLISSIPFAFPTAGLNAKQQKIAGWDQPTYAKPGPGIVAHRDFASHADGRYELEALMPQTRGVPTRKGKALGKSAPCPVCEKAGHKCPSPHGSEDAAQVSNPG